MAEELGGKSRDSCLCLWQLLLVEKTAIKPLCSFEETVFFDDFDVSIRQPDGENGFKLFLTKTQRKLHTKFYNAVPLVGTKLDFTNCLRLTYK